MILCAQFRSAIFGKEDAFIENMRVKKSCRFNSGLGSSATLDLPTLLEENPTL